MGNKYGSLAPPDAAAIHRGRARARILDTPKLDPELLDPELSGEPAPIPSAPPRSAWLYRPDHRHVAYFDPDGEHLSIHLPLASSAGLLSVTTGLKVVFFDREQAGVMARILDHYAATGELPSDGGAV